MDKPDVERTITFPRWQMQTPAVDVEELCCYLVMIEGGEPGRRIPIGDRPITVGRDPGRDLVLADTNVSRLHLEIVPKQGEVTVVDRGSTNGTLVNGKRVTTAVLSEGHLLQVGSHVLRFERRSKREVQRSEELTRDLDKASHYVRSLLPDPLTEGPVRTDWFFQPSLQLGGDVFGYEFLDSNTLSIYLIDVSGHGAGAAMHSVSVLNVLRQRAMAQTDIRQPAEVLAGLNALFQMDRHDGMFLTMWYGVYDIARRTMRYGTAGHHPAYLVAPDRREALPLKTPGLMIGAAPNSRFNSGEATVQPGSSMYLFSDGVFEIATADQGQWRIGDFLPLLMQPPQPGIAESMRIHGAVRRVARPGPFDDDFSLLAVTFP